MPVVHGNDNTLNEIQVTPSVEKVTDWEMLQTEVGPSFLEVTQPNPQAPMTQSVKMVAPPLVLQKSGTPAGTLETPPAPPATSPVSLTPPEEAKQGPVEVKVGVFITALHGLKLHDQSYTISFWGWFVHDSKSYKPDTTEIINAYSYKRDNFIVTPRGKFTWAQIQFTARVAHNWNISDFPFDRQVLQLFLEDSQHDNSEVKYIVDDQNSKVDDSTVILADWKILDFNITAGPRTVHSTFGDPKLANGNSTYSRITVSITLERKGTRLFFSMFSALYIAFLLSSVAFFVPIENISARLSLATASIVAAIGNKYVVDSMLPPTTSLTLVDKIQVTTFLYVGVMVFVTAAYAYFGSKREAITRRFNDYSGVILPFFYILLNVYWVYLAIQNY